MGLFFFLLADLVLLCMRHDLCNKYHYKSMITMWGRPIGLIIKINKLSYNFMAA